MGTIDGSGDVTPMGETRFKCPNCKKWIRIQLNQDDYVCTNCATKWKITNGDRKRCFKHSNLAAGKHLGGMKTEDNRTDRDALIDTETYDDTYIELR